MNKIIIATATAAATAAAVILSGSILANQSARAWGTWVVETHEYKDESYSIHDFNSIAGGRDLRVVVPAIRPALLTRTSSKPSSRS